jgi:hypothetical protein
MLTRRKQMEIGQRVQLKFLHKPTGTITGIVDGFTMNGVTLIGLSYSVQWDDGSIGESVRGNELELMGVEVNQEKPI